MSRHVIISATGAHTATMIFLHGLGDSGAGWASTIAALKPSNTKLICPTAEVMPVTLNMGFQMTSWFDLYTLDNNGPEDEAGIEKAKKYIHGLIESEEKAGIPSNRILLGGFSQGGALALYSGLAYPKPLAGILALSCWIPLHKKLSFQTLANRNTPTFQCHGDMDDVVAFSFGEQTSELLKKHLTNYKFKPYKNLRHTNIAGPEAMKDMKEFIQKYLN